MKFRIGQGFDAHRLTEGCNLVIGGVKIPWEKGSEGHSDGDTLMHAIVDALLGAVSQGDIGIHFPSSDNRWKDADSGVFLKHAFNLVKAAGFSISNIDSTVILQEPRLKDAIPRMRCNIAKLLHLDLDQVSVKATTTDFMGFTGRSEGIAASAVVLLQQQ